MTVPFIPLEIYPVTPYDTVNANDKANGVYVRGIAEPDSVVQVMWGQAQHTVQTNPWGDWGTMFAPPEVPADGNTVIFARSRDEAGNFRESSHFVVVDTVVAAPTIDTVANDNIVNAFEQQVGVNVTGTAEAGSAVKVSWGNTEHTVTADYNGTWSSTFAQTEVPADGRTAITAIATNVAGNVSTSATHAVTVDTVLSEPEIFPVTPFDTVNARDKAYGVYVHGIAEPDSVVQVMWGQAQHTVQTDSWGEWASMFTSPEVPADGNTFIVAVARDEAGNVRESSQFVVVDTVMAAPTINPVANDNIVNAAEKEAGVTVSGTAEAGIEVQVRWGNTEHTVTADYNGTWASSFATNEVPADGNSTISAVATVQTGNVSAPATQTVTVDTTMAAPTINTVANDNIVNAFEQWAGVNVSGTAEAGSAVNVSWGNAEHTVTAANNGVWSSTFAQTEVPADGRLAITAIATDVAGNISASATHAVTVDTVLSEPEIFSVTPFDIVNARDKANGVYVHGIADADSVVQVMWGQAQHTVQTNPWGDWASMFASPEVPADGYAPIVAVARDEAGNIRENYHFVMVDTGMAQPETVYGNTAQSSVAISNFTPEQVHSNTGMVISG